MSKCRTDPGERRESSGGIQDLAKKIGLDIDPTELIMRVREAGAKRPRLTAPVDTVVSKIQVSKVTECKITYGGIEDD